MLASTADVVGVGAQILLLNAISKVQGITHQTVDVVFAVRPLNRNPTIVTDVHTHVARIKPKTLTMEAKPAILLLFINGVISEPVRPFVTTEIRQIEEHSMHRASHQAPNDFETLGVSVIDTLSKSVDSARLMLALEHICVRVIIGHRVFNNDTTVSFFDDSFKTRRTSLESQSTLIVFR